MTQDRWRKMDEADRVEYLDKQSIEIESQQFLNGNKNVGDMSAVSKKFRAKMGGVIMSTWRDSEELARDAAQLNLESMKEALADG